jgi:hypothetical protein
MRKRFKVFSGASIAPKLEATGSATEAKDLMKELMSLRPTSDQSRRPEWATTCHFFRLKELAQL